jgi:hypothetical protein
MEKAEKDEKVLKMIKVVGDRQLGNPETLAKVSQLMTIDLRIVIKLIDDKLHINPLQPSCYYLYDHV